MTVKNCGIDCNYFDCPFDSVKYQRVYLCNHPKSKHRKINVKDVRLVLRGKIKFPKRCPFNT